MNWFYRLPTFVLSAFVSAGYIAFTMAFLESVEVIDLIPDDGFPEALFPCFLFGPIFLWANWQFRVVMRSAKSDILGRFGIVPSGILLLVSGCFTLVSLDGCVSHILSNYEGTLIPLFQIFNQWTGDTLMIALTGLPFIATPVFVAGALIRLEGKFTFKHCFFTALLIFLFPVGVWWLQPRVQKLVQRTEPEIVDHFGI